MRFEETLLQSSIAFSRVWMNNLNGKMFIKKKNRLRYSMAYLKQLNTFLFVIVNYKHALKNNLRFTV